MSRGRVWSSAEARELLSAGKVKYESGDKMTALQLWEKALSSDPDNIQRKTALYNCTCVHAGFGDVELAQITLRDAVLQGLDFKEVLNSPSTLDNDAVSLVASQQVLIRLKKFSDAASKAGIKPGVEKTGFPKGQRQRIGSVNDDLSEVLETDMIGIDTSVIGIIRRVLLLLAVLIGLGVGLWFVGLNYLFPREF
jgi:hypothetical protein